MPLDGSEIDYKPDADLMPCERGYRLVHELRNLPPEFTWNFLHVQANDCGTAGCAIGYIMYRWPAQNDPWDRAAFFGLSHKALHDCCAIVEYKLWRHDGVTLAKDVTPLMVADALEAALDGGGSDS